MSDSVLEAPARPEPANYVGGSWSPARSGRTYEKRNPARPSELVGKFPASGEEDVNDAVEAAASAFPTWSALPAAGRAGSSMRAADAIEARVEDMASDMTREMGKPLREARMESARTAAIFRFFAGEAWRPTGELYEQSATGSTLYTLRRPLGVVGLITPWNFPAAIPAWKLAPALIYGNTVVLKLAQEAPLTGPPHRCGAGRGRHPRRRAECRHRTRLGSRHDPRHASQGSGDLVHRLGRRGPPRAGTGNGAREASPARARGPEPPIVAADADLSRAVEAAYAGAFSARREEVHGNAAHLRRGTRVRRVPGAPPRADREREGRGSSRPRDRGWPARERKATERRDRRDRAGQARGWHGAGRRPAL